MAFIKSVAESSAQRLASEKLQLEKKLENTPPGSGEHEAIVRQIRQLDTAASMDGWLSSPGLQPPT